MYTINNTENLCTSDNKDEYNDKNVNELKDNIDKNNHENQLKDDTNKNQDLNQQNSKISINDNLNLKDNNENLNNNIDNKFEIKKNDGSEYQLNDSQELHN